MSDVGRFVTMLQQLARGEIGIEDAQRIEADLNPDARMSRDYETIRELYQRNKITLEEAQRRCERIGHIRDFERDHSLPLEPKRASRLYK